MAIALSDAVAQQQAQALADAFSGGFIRIFSGTRPANPYMAETGTLLGVVSVNAVANAGLHYVANGGAVSKAAEQWAFKALATGTVSWFRLVTAGDTGAEDPEALRIDGDIGTPSLPADMTWKSTAVTNGVPYTIDSFVYLIQPIG